jgi:biotin carboxylase
VDPFDNDAADKIEIDYPFWLKPIKATESMLAFKIADDKELREALQQTREHIETIAAPFNYVLSHIDLPQELAGVDGCNCIAEGMASGDLHTVEGYVYDGEVYVHGVIDSINYPDSSSFFRYQYPSSLPNHIQQRMIEASHKVISRLRVDNSTYNIEYFYDQEQDRISLLEINPRISQSHTEMFKDVDGDSNHEILIELALGNKPKFPKRQGRHKCAAKFYLRRFEDGVVANVPSDEEVKRIEREIGDVVINVEVEEGMRLSKKSGEEDSYSYVLATMHIGAQDQDELMDKYTRCAKALDLKFSD